MSWNRVTVVTPPDDYALNVETVKSWLRLTDDDDSHDVRLIDAIRRATAEIDGPEGIGYALMTQTWRLTVDRFPWNTRSQIQLPGAPIKSVSAIRYVDTNGDTQNLDSSAYILDAGGTPARLEPAYGLSWPTTRDQIGAVQVEYVVGEDNADNIAQDLLDAMSLIISHRFENTEEVSPTQLHKIPRGAESILQRYRQSYIAA